MNAKEIVESFRYNKEKEFMFESVIEARKNKEEVTELLLKELELVSNNIEKYIEDKDYMLHFYAVYLLAEFREKRAFPLVIKIISQEDRKKLENLLGNFITEDLSSVLASTFDGNINALYDIIVNDNLYEYVRSAAFRALGILQDYNVITKEQVLQIGDVVLNNVLDKNSDEGMDSLVSGIINYIADSKIYDRIGLVRKLYSARLVDEFFTGPYDEFIDVIYGNETYLKEEMIDDVISFFGVWVCFNKSKKVEEYIKQRNADIKKEETKLEKIDDKKEEDKSKVISLEKLKNIGRNDPCYCRLW